MQTFDFLLTFSRLGDFTLSIGAATHHITGTVLTDIWPSFTNTCMAHVMLLQGVLVFSLGHI